MLAWFHRLPRRTRQIVVGFIGWAVVLVGLVLVPYPGPGWVIVFIGLSILATEFERAARLHTYAHGKYDLWQLWYGRQPIYIKAIFWCLTCATAAISVWLLNGYGMVNDWLHIGYNWLQSPFIK